MWTSEGVDKTVMATPRTTSIKNNWSVSLSPCYLQKNSDSTISPSVMFIESCVLLSAIEYMIFLHQQRKKQEEELEALRKEVMALKIMKA